MRNRLDLFLKLSLNGCGESVTLAQIHKILFTWHFIEYMGMDSHFGQNEYLIKIRHSCEHVLTQAMEAMFPSIVKANGPATEDGFYFDFELPEGEKITAENFPDIEAKMREIIKKKLKFSHQEVTINEAREIFKNNKYKLEWLDIIESKGDMPTLYWTGSIDDPRSFVDLCAGPHVENTSEIKAFKLLSVAGAYWRGDSKNKMLTRVYGTAFGSKEELEEFLRRKEEAKQRDHRKIGKEMKLFTFAPEEIGQGLVLWLENGMIVRDSIEDWVRETERRFGYKRVSTPIIGKEDLYKCSGHLKYFKDDMYAPLDIDGDKYYLRPMNCPHHHYIYKSDMRSYRDLPLRIAEYGTVFRYEESGALNGIMRPRGFCINDAHIYCREEQIKSEFINVLEMYRYYYAILGITDYYMRLSQPDLTKTEKYVNNVEKWERTQNIIREAMQEVNFPYVEVQGEAAFYGPKVDVQIRSAIGTEYTISTNQLDFMSAERFGLTYVGEDGQQHYVYVIHRAPLGSHERMIGYLIEHYAGAFPVWLAPVQVALLPVSERHLAYCQELQSELSQAGVRVQLLSSNDTVGYKIREAYKFKVPYVVMVGDKELQSNTVSVRDRNGQQKNDLVKEDFKKLVAEIIANKSLALWRD